MVDVNADVIRGARPALTRRNKVALAIAAAWLVVYVLFFVDGDKWTYSVILAVPLAVNLVRQLRPSPVVTSEGISRPWHRRSFLPWASIEHVVQPAHLNDVQVVGTDGCTYSVSGIDASLSDEVAALGAKPVRPQQVPAPKPVTPMPTQREIEADVARRAAALAEERQRMSESQKRRFGS